MIDDKKKKQKENLKRFLILGILVIILSILFLIPFTYEAIEFYNVEEPYNDIEYYWENEPYENCWDKLYSYTVDNKHLFSDCSRQTCVDRSWWDDSCLDYDCTEYTYTYKVELQNNEKRVGNFEIKAHFNTINGKIYGDLKSVYLQANSEKTLTWTYKVPDYGDVQTASHELIKIPEYEHCETHVKEVKKSRTVTKYQTVQKERQIHKKDILFNMITKQTQYVFYE